MTYAGAELHLPVLHHSIGWTELGDSSAFIGDKVHADMACIGGLFLAILFMGSCRKMLLDTGQACFDILRNFAYKLRLHRIILH